MKIIIQNPQDNEEDTIIFNVKQLTENMQQAIALLVDSPKDLTVYLDEKAHLVPIVQVFYIESVDLKTFVYGEKTVYRSKLKLYEVENLLQNSDFLRISKQTLVNIKKIKNVAPAGSGRFMLNLHNGEKLVVSRQYVKDLKGRFGL